MTKKILNYFTIITISLFIFIFFYIFYRSEIYSGFSRFSYYKNFYLITIIFIIYFSFSFFFSIKIRIINFICLFILSTTIYSFEIYKYYIGKPKFDIYKEFKNRLKTNSRWSVTFPPKHVINYYTEIFSSKNYLPLSGISKINTLNCNENGYWSTYFSDRYGFNNEDEIWDNQIDFTLVGDSYTAGACVNPENNISGNIQKLGYRVLNLGYGGNGPLIQLAGIIEFVPLVQTQKILWFYSNNDLDDLNLEKTNQFLTSYLKKKSKNLSTNQSEIDRIYKDYLKSYKKQSDLISILKLERFRKNIKLFKKNISGPVDDLNYDILINDLKEILSVAKEITYQNDQQFYFIYLPGKENFYPKKYEDTYKKVNKLKPKLIRMVKDLDINIIDLENYLDKEDPSKIFPKRGHYNSKGYKVIAEALLKNLK